MEIVQDICGLNTERNDLLNIRNSVNELLSTSNNAIFNLKLSALKVKILDLEEQEMIYVERKDYTKVQQILEQKNVATMEFTQLIKPLLEKRAADSVPPVQLPFTKVVKNEFILRGLQITFYLIASTPDKQSLGHATYRLYNVSGFYIKTHLIFRIIIYTIILLKKNRILYRVILLQMKLIFDVGL